ncbi:urease accessory protein UreF [Tribonema minus]|uniref:Urease accessory protein UreF n=1 Tax=Tribonema minus TaxID=303371 RepID=A0A836CDD6_9STRA|nr:urease accessory protein UreF [Tribonema minus]
MTAGIDAEADGTPSVGNEPAAARAVWSVQWLTWQLCDSALPTGGFAHSNGLEASVAAGAVSAADPHFLAQFLKSCLANAVALQVPMLRAVWDTGAGGSEGLLKAWLQADALANAVITSHVARRASAAQGCALLRLACEALLCTGAHGDALTEFRKQLRLSQSANLSVQARPVAPSSLQQHSGAAAKSSGENLLVVWVWGHLAPAFGFVCLSAGIDAAAASRMFLYTVARDVLSAANRLSLIGPMQGARLLADISGYVDLLLLENASTAECIGLPLEQQVAQVDPVLELLQASHEQLYSRLFNS